MHRIDITDLVAKLDSAAGRPFTRQLRLLVPIGEVVTAASLAAATFLTIRGHDQGHVTVLAGIAAIGLLPYLARLWLGFAAGLEIETKIRKRGRDAKVELPPGAWRSMGDIAADLDHVRNAAQRLLQRAKPPVIARVWPVLLMVGFLTAFRFRGSELHLFADALLLLFVVILYYIPMHAICARGGRDMTRNIVGLALAALLAFVATGVSLYGFTEIYQVKHSQLDFTVVGLSPFIFFLLSQRLGYWASASADEALAADLRHPSLFLRAFEDENAAAGSESLLTSSGGNLHIPIEHMISNRIARYGPFIAIGDPKTRHITIGANRHQIRSDEDWKEVVLGYMKAARIIVMLAARTQGTTWELQQIAQEGLTDKLLLIFPAIDWQTDAQKQERLELVRSCFVGTPLHDALLDLDIRALRAVVVDPRTGPIAIACRTPSDTAYEIAVMIGLCVLLANVMETAAQAAPGSPARDVPASNHACQQPLQTADLPSGTVSSSAARSSAIRPGLLAPGMTAATAARRRPELFSRT